MPKPTKGPRIGGTPTHERIILANLASQLFEHGRITTTETKAKRMQPLVERLISKATKGDLHNRRQVLEVITDKSVVHILFTEIAPQMEGREGGFTRITKVGPRKGDNAPMAVIELVLEKVQPKQKAEKPAAEEAQKAEETPVEEAPVEETPAEETAEEAAPAEEAAADEAPAEDATEVTAAEAAAEADKA